MNVVTKRSVLYRPVFLSGCLLEEVSQVKVLGCILSNDLKWNAFVNHIVKNASRRIYLILSLKRAGCPSKLLFTAYCAYVRSLLLSAYPVICNMPLYLKRKLIGVERRILRIIDDEDFNKIDLFSAGDQICKNLFSKVVCEPEHPLRFFYETKSVILRNGCLLRKPKSKTQRFLNSFIKYCP